MLDLVGGVTGADGGNADDVSTGQALGISLGLVAVAVLVMVGYAWAMGSAHQLNSAHSRLGVQTDGRGQVVVRFLACPDEVVDHVEVVVPADDFRVVWRIESPDAASLARGITVPVELSGDSYEAVVVAGPRQAGQEFDPARLAGPGEVLVRDHRRPLAEYEQRAEDSCGDP